MLVSLYRVLQGVSQNKSAVAGYLYKNNLSMTLAHLQEAVRYSKYTHHNVIDKTVDDSVGELETTGEEKTKTLRMLEAATKALDQSSQLIKEIENMNLPVSMEHLDRKSVV